MGRIIEVNESIFVPVNRQIAYKTGVVIQNLDDAVDHLQKLRDPQGAIGYIAMARAFAKDINMIVKGPDFIDWI